MLQENELHGWLKEALVAIERLQEASNSFSISLEKWKVFEIRDVFVTCGQLLKFYPAERPVMTHYVSRMPTNK